MFWSLAPLVLACLVLAGMVGMCSFQGSGPQRGQIPNYDVATALKADAETLGFPIRLPALPDGWHPNSGSRDGIDGAHKDPATGRQVRAKVSTVGYIAPSGMYVSLTQSNADEDKLVRSIHAEMYPDRCPGCRGCDVDRLRGWFLRRRRARVDHAPGRSGRRHPDRDNGGG